MMKCDMGFILAKLMLACKYTLKTEVNSLLLTEVLVLFIRKMHTNFSEERFVTLFSFVG